MEHTRRTFFATLFASLLTKPLLPPKLWIWKPRSLGITAMAQGETMFWIGNAGMYEWRPNDVQMLLMKAQINRSMAEMRRLLA
jgi:hypothetical protein